MTRSRLVSIIMPVYNAEDFLPQSIESILNQTYSNFEFIIIDDASTDKSWQIIKSYTLQDKRIRIFKNSKNHGVSYTANKAIKLSHGQFLARMDADDISFPDRIEKQVNFLIKNPQVIIIGGQCVVIDQNNQILGYKYFPTNPKILREMIFRSIPLQQPSSMINRNLLPPSFAWYSSNCTSAEEVDLIFKLMLFGQISNLPNQILFYRYLPQSLSHKHPRLTFKITLYSRIRALKYGYRPTFKSILINLFQLAFIYIIPEKLANYLWLEFRFIKSSIPKTTPLSLKYNYN